MIKMAKTKVLKKYVLIISETFPKGKLREGEKTEFYQKIKDKIKIHTVRDNYEFWRKRVEEVQKGNGYISVRGWTGKPYRSEQKEMFRFHKEDGVGIEPMGLNDLSWMCIGDKNADVETLAKNDGLSKAEFQDWFKSIEIGQKKAIIHFTNFRYLN